MPEQLMSPENLLLQDSDTASTVVYILGSSRVGNGIDGSALRNALGKNVHILSFAGANFMCNTIMAQTLIQKTGQKILLIELSPVSSHVASEWLTFMYANNVSPLHSFNQVAASDDLWRYRNLYINLYNDVLVQHFNLGQEKKWLSEGNRNPIWVFAPRQGGEVKTTQSFLTPGELTNQVKQYEADTSHLMQMVRIIQSGAKNSDCNVLYFTPVNFRSQVERQMVRTIWQKLPASQRIHYPDSFLNALSHASYLYDDIHLNTKGAAAFTKFWIPILDSLLHVRD